MVGSMMRSANHQLHRPGTTRNVGPGPSGLFRHSVGADRQAAVSGTAKHGDGAIRAKSSIPYKHGPLGRGSSISRPSIAGHNGHLKPGERIPGFQTSFDVSAKGGGSFKPIGDNFFVNPANGTFSLTIPIQASPTRGGFAPDLSLSYGSGEGNGAFGFGWSVPFSSIYRNTAHHVPLYEDDEDGMVLSGADLVLQIGSDRGVERRWTDGFEVTKYRPRVDSKDLVIEKWVNQNNLGDVHWRTISATDVATIYGHDDDSRIFCIVNGKKQIFSWLISKSYDSHGNAIDYSYKQEDGKGIEQDGMVPIWEYHRSDDSRSRQKYIKRIKYGNRTPSRDLGTWKPSSWPQDWMFEVVFDYGEHDLESPGMQDLAGWSSRKDAFSTANSGFEIRTYRICRRILMFHHFPSHLGVSENLVSSTTFEYDESSRGTFLKRVTSAGHALKKDDALGTATEYTTETLPSLRFRYSTPPELHAMKALEVNVANLLDIPDAGSAMTSEWLDLDGEGIPGLMSRLHDGTLVYQRHVGIRPSSDDDDENQSPFGAPEFLDQQPSLGHGWEGRFQDLDGNGRLDLVYSDSAGRPQGFYEREDSDSWSEFSNFLETPTGELYQDAPALRLDLTGDGLVDTLFAVGEGQDLVWRQGLGKKGQSGYRRSFSCASKSGNAPRLSRTQQEQTRTADMTGDGLSDLVEITASKITYWQNLGHGSFGAAVEMANCPVLDAYGLFDHSRVMLMDVDGSGTTDLLYLLPEGGADLFYNQAGNSWSDGVFIPHIPKAAMPSSIFMLDVLGKGTACLCWVDASSSSARQVHYLDLMDKKPYLLREYANGMGSVTTVTYKPSTEFYLHDLRSNQPWATKLPFPVQCVSTVCVTDEITGNSMSTEYAYHNGCYDAVEKQFSGFEMVEQWQHEKLRVGADETYETPQTYTKSWFSVGQSLGVDEKQFVTPSQVSSCMDDILDNRGSLEAFRALRGTRIRTETYQLDGTERAALPFQIEELSYDVRQLQTRGKNKHAVFRVTSRAVLSTQYERCMEDPRVTHEIVLKTSAFGDIEEVLKVVYPRTAEHAGSTGFGDIRGNQMAGNVSVSRFWHTKLIQEDDCFRKPMPWRHQDWEVLGFPFPQGTMLDVDEMRKYAFGELPEIKSAKPTWRALREEQRAIFRSSDLTRPLDPGELQMYSVPHRSYSLAFTPEILAKVKLGQDKCGIDSKDLDISTLLEHQGGYVDLDRDGRWWAPSSYAGYLSHPGSSSEVEKARAAFYVPADFFDAFNNPTSVVMDEDFLMAKRTTDAVENSVIFKNDYERLHPTTIIDENSNRHEAMLDELGRIIAVANTGKGDGSDECDSLECERIVRDEDVDDILSNPSGATAARLLGNCGTRVLFRPDRYSRWKQDNNTVGSISNASSPMASPLAMTISRGLPFRQSKEPEIHIEVTYVSGLMAAVQELTLNDPMDPAKTWLVAASTVSNAAGNAVRTFEPRFAPTSTLVPPRAIKAESSSTIFHDAMGRQAGVLRPDHTWSKTVFTPWTVTEYGSSDTLLVTPQDDSDVGAYFSRVQSSWYLPSWHEIQSQGTAKQQLAAAKSSKYGASPSVTHSGSCGLPIRTVRRTGDKTYTRAFAYDSSGNKTHDFDAGVDMGGWTGPGPGRLVEKSVFDQLGRSVGTFGMDSGESWSLQDALGHLMLAWNSRGISFWYHYDKLHREVERWTQKGEQARKMVVKTVYGEEAPREASSANLRGKIWQVKDQSGVYTHSHFDIRGRCTEKAFIPARDYKSGIDWKAEEDDRVLEKTEPFVHRRLFDSNGHILEEENARQNRTRRRFSRLGHVEQVDFCHGERGEWERYLVSSEFAADGLPLRHTYGNGICTTYSYDPRSRMLISQLTTRGGSNQSSRAKAASSVLEDLTHTYDCNGRRVHTVDASEQQKYFQGCLVRLENEYTYDAIGQLVCATGRGQLPSSAGKGTLLEPYAATTGGKPARGVTDGSKLYEYLESYEYDLAGNIVSMQHEAPKNRWVTGWTRRYWYGEQSLLSSDPKVQGNRLSRTSVGDTLEVYGYDGDAGRVGCITKLPKYSQLQWDMDNRLSASSTQFFGKGVPSMTYYVYDHTGKRVRKVTESSAASGSEPSKVRDTLYLEGVEIRVKQPDEGMGKRSVRAIAHVTGSELLLALVETVDDSNTILNRYQVGHNLELDDQGQLVSYEEYSPYGSMTYTAVHADVEAPRVYRFARYEHDQETGLYHCGARYYCPWLGRWTSPDPLGDVDGPNLYQYVTNDPVNFDDPAGTSRNNFGYRIRPVDSNYKTRRALSEAYQGHEKMLQRHARGSGALLDFLVKTQVGEFLPQKEALQHNLNLQLPKIQASGKIPPNSYRAAGDKAGYGKLMETTKGYKEATEKLATHRQHLSNEATVLTYKLDHANIMGTNYGAWRAFNNAQMAHDKFKDAKGSPNIIDEDKNALSTQTVASFKRVEEAIPNSNRVEQRFGPDLPDSFNLRNDVRSMEMTNDRILNGTEVKTDTGVKAFRVTTRFQGKMPETATRTLGKSVYKPKQYNH